MKHDTQRSTTHRQHSTESPTAAGSAARSTQRGRASWQELAIQIPNERSGESRVAFLEAVLVELTHESVGAVHTPGAVSDESRLEVVCTDDVGEEFELRQYHPRHGWETESLSRAGVRKKLRALVERAPSDGGGVAVDTFSVQHAGTLQSRCVEVRG
jgi:hypothetical protein